ncbi:hypothetical protein D3C76_1749460 [compost metagenome]
MGRLPTFHSATGFSHFMTTHDLRSGGALLIAHTSRAAETGARQLPVGGAMMMKQAVRWREKPEEQ